MAASGLKSEACGSVIQPKHLFLQQILTPGWFHYAVAASGLNSASIAFQALENRMVQMPQIKHSHIYGTVAAADLVRQ